MVIIIFFLSITLIISIYININLTRKFDKIQEMAENSVDVLMENENFLQSLKNRLRSQQTYLRHLDRIGAIESDDETGYFFKELKSVVNDISAYFGEIPITNDQRNSVLDKKIFDAKNKLAKEESASIKALIKKLETTDYDSQILKAQDEIDTIKYQTQNLKVKVEDANKSLSELKSEIDSIDGQLKNINVESN